MKRHRHWWIEDERASALIDGWIYDCACGASKEVYIEQDGARTVIRERDRENAGAAAR